MFSFQNLQDIFIKRNLLSKYHLNRIGVFGSILHSNEPGDIDLLVEDSFNYKDLIGMKSELEEASGKPVDVVIAKHASPIILHRAKKEMRYVS